MYSRAEFTQQTARTAAVQSSQERRLAVFAVLGGLLQLPLIGWLKRTFGGFAGTHIALAVFLVYAAVVVMMMVRMNRAVDRTAPVCPACGVKLTKLSERMAIATGKCDRCGAQVIS